MLRGGPDAVPGAVALAAALGPWEQFSAWMIFGGLPGGPDPVNTVRARIQREWRDRRLQVTPPPAGFYEPIDWNNPAPRREPVRYRTPLGHNAA